MKSIPNKFRSLNCTSYALIKGNKKTILYEYETLEGTKETYRVSIPMGFIRIGPSSEIVDQSADFVCGLKVVQTANGEFAYVREVDGELLPYRFDIASDFNEYGFAMVGKNDEVAWIDTKFDFIDFKGQFTPCTFDARREDYNIPSKIAATPTLLNSNTRAWNGVYTFCEGSEPVSALLFTDRQSTSYVSYMTTRGAIIKFQHYDGNRITDLKTSFPLSEFRSPVGTQPYDYTRFSFDETGHKMLESEVLFKLGFYCQNTDIINISAKKGWLDSIKDDGRSITMNPINNKDLNSNN